MRTINPLKSVLRLSLAGLSKVFLWDLIFYALVSPIFVYGIRHLYVYDGKIIVLLVITLIFFYQYIISRTIEYKKARLKYMVEVYKMAKTKYKIRDITALRESFIKVAYEKIISKEKDNKKKKLLDEYLDRLFEEADSK